MGAVVNLSGLYRQWHSRQRGHFLHVASRPSVRCYHTGPGLQALAPILPTWRTHEGNTRYKPQDHDNKATVKAGFPHMIVQSSPEEINMLLPPPPPPPPPATNVCGLMNRAHISLAFLTLSWLSARCLSSSSRRAACSWQ